EFESRCSQTARLHHEDSLKPEGCSISSKVKAALTFQLFPRLMSHRKGVPAHSVPCRQPGPEDLAAHSYRFNNSQINATPIALLKEQRHPGLKRESTAKLSPFRCDISPGKSWKVKAALTLDDIEHSSGFNESSW
uniref:MATH domain-containing protein n=1 Tax=Bursaphelenchus xylophilus TaxID=6326 RepID=A0A1I7SNJ2_BURXY